MTLLRISARAHPIKTAKAIVGMIHKHKHAEIQALGHLAVQQVETAIAKATAHLEDEGIDIIVAKAILIKAGAEGNQKSGIKFIVEQCRKPPSFSARSQEP